MTRLEIRNLSRKKLGESSGVFWSDAELNSWITEACEDIAYKTKAIKTNGYMTPLLDTKEYTLSSVYPNLLSIDRLYHKTEGSIWTELHPICSYEDFDLRFSGWMNTPSGTPTDYYYSKEEDLLIIYPAPTSTNAGSNYVRTYYTRTFSGLSDDSSTPNLPEPLHLAIVDWVTATGYETRGYGDKANDALSKYMNRLQAYKVEAHREKEDDDIIMRGYRS
jgi:hypothetical protein